MNDAGERLDRVMAHPGFRMRMNELRRVERYRDRPRDARVSVIMPAWNRGFILPRAIESVLEQSYGNLELIVADDGSTDGTARVVADRFGSDTRVRYLDLPHGGVSHARNAALAESGGSIVAYLDTDNVWREHYLLIMVQALLETTGHDSAYCAATVRNRIGGTESFLFRPWDRTELLERNYIDLNTFVHRRTLLDDLGDFDEAIEGVEDWDLILRYTRDRGPLVVDCALVDYHFDPSYDHLTLRADLEDNVRRVRVRHGSG